ncbi:hypothetical protein [Kitasatospora mediocidica]|uniref:hypothetical protein n=1 Tax=Kitasatospora mediocidica TaxID=58352 RepID=UPI000569C22A|nr:hypothetical protein [Kitasatospora mediocidica]
MFNRDRKSPSDAEVSDAVSTEVGRRRAVAFDPDAAAILKTNALETAYSKKAAARFEAEVETYAAVKKAKGQGGLGKLFFG